MVDALSAAVEQARARGAASGGLTAGDLLRFPRALVVEELELDEAGRAELGRAATAAVEDVLRDLDAMRVREGGYLLADLGARCRTLSDLVARLEAAAESGRAELVSRLNARLEELRAQAGVEEAAVAQEVVRFAARSDVSEEITRLRGHLAHWSALTGATEPCGRKLDFLLQEMNREVNTLGAKVEGADASELVVTPRPSSRSCGSRSRTSSRSARRGNGACSRRGRQSRKGPGVCAVERCRLLVVRHAIIFGHGRGFTARNR